MVQLHANALRPDELDSSVLPLYEKYNIKHDVYTYQNLSKMFLNLQEFDIVKNLYKALKEDGIQPNKMICNTVLETALRTDDSDLVFESLTDFVDIKQDPHFRLKGKLANLEDLPDRIYLLLRENWGVEHKALTGERKMAKPVLRKSSDIGRPAYKKHGTRYKHKKATASSYMSKK